MRSNKRRILSLVLAVVMAIGLTVPALAAEESKKTITILQTSDIHGMVTPFDYAANKPQKASMAHVAAIVKAERAKDPDLLLLDSGDTIQANYIQNFLSEEPIPIIDALNYLDYDAWTLGNHEFNFGFDVVNRAIRDFDGPVLGGNIYKKDGSRWLDAYHIFEVDGIKVAVFGMDAPHIPQWEKSDPTHYDNMSFTTPMEECGKILDELEGKADVIIGSVHYGPDGEYGTEGMREVTEKYADRLDGMFIGHAHSKVNELIKGCPMLEPANNGKCVSKLVIDLEQKDGKWVVTEKKGEILDCAEVEPDPDFLARYKGLHEKSLALAGRAIGEVGETFMDPVFMLPGIPTAIIQDNPITDLVNKVQMLESGADTSLAALFTANANLEKGPFLDRDSVKIYKYDNTLFGVKVTGKQLKAIMEAKAGDFFNQYQPGDVTISFNPDIRMYNYDMFAGVNYDIDISKPAGQRIVNVTFKGKPLADDQQLTLALNNYRFGGLVSAGLIDEKDVYYEGGAVRDMISDYVAKLGKPLMPECDHNWKIIGAPLDDPQKDLIYSMVEKGELTIPTSEDGRTPNIASLNGPALRAEGKLPALPEEKPAPVVPEVKPEPKPEVKPEPKPVEPVAPVVPSGSYVVVQGDCLWNIAARELGSGAKWQAIFEANRDTIRDPAVISVGQVLVLPAA